MVAMGNERGVEVDIFDAVDDAIVVQIDTGQDGRTTGRLRVNVNDGVVWDGDPERESDPLFLYYQRVAALEAAAMQLALDFGGVRADMAAKLFERGAMI
jgi:hypothetical protein